MKQKQIYYNFLFLNYLFNTTTISKDDEKKHRYIIQHINADT